jgi:hypothetical protein
MPRPNAEMIRPRRLCLRLVCHKYKNLFHTPQVDAMLLFMWQDDMSNVAWFIDACPERLYTLAGPLMEDQASDQS